jgi:hypothetical protein
MTLVCCCAELILAGDGRRVFETIDVAPHVLLLLLLLLLLMLTFSFTLSFPVTLCRHVELPLSPYLNLVLPLLLLLFGLCLLRHVLLNGEPRGQIKRRGTSVMEARDGCRTSRLCVALWDGCMTDRRLTRLLRGGVSKGRYSRML